MRAGLTVSYTKLRSDYGQHSNYANNSHSHISGYTTVDVVETEDENDDGSPRWIVLELGDGGSCDPAPDQDMCAHWQ